jgi:predicted transposase
LDLMRRFSNATPFAYNRLLEGETVEELKRDNDPLCALFDLDARHADEAVEEAQALIASAKDSARLPGGEILPLLAPIRHIAHLPFAEEKFQDVLPQGITRTVVAHFLREFVCEEAQALLAREGAEGEQGEGKLLRNEKPGVVPSFFPFDPAKVGYLDG